MFAKAERLNRAEFTHTYQHGRKIHLPGLMLVYLHASTQKVAVVVGKKVAKSAAARNLLKRRLYAALYDAQLSAGHFIVIGKPAIRTYPYAQLQTEVTTALNRIVGVRTNSR